MKGRITGDKYVKYMLCILFAYRNVAKWYYLCTKFHANLSSGSKVISGGGTQKDGSTIGIFVCSIQIKRQWPGPSYPPNQIHEPDDQAASKHEQRGWPLPELVNRNPSSTFSKDTEIPCPRSECPNCPSQNTNQFQLVPSFLSHPLITSHHPSDSPVALEVPICLPSLHVPGSFPPLPDCGLPPSSITELWHH
jgi:hypothetical protein